eukprot:CAMPEP_0181207452 /NCGR_PEP_ID=MMETSP1096-20121128/21593_1 /TAXON_ID=156174 ORGANISM="Chrysochromulina ericina, Strain CCMP281" /NCGR_SAMPLE_ID=MMETSP1096 /ASSEMBLY_ACC=CAM_ASM_000453 /LENGTH=87 /DNA_ID=CAMNT_0023298453 /DNA_START=26 /DNA_END=287 /DNA_ORIENTATION=-
MWSARSARLRLRAHGGGVEAALTPAACQDAEGAGGAVPAPGAQPMVCGVALDCGRALDCGIVAPASPNSTQVVLVARLARLARLTAW